jgi:hypothetical protein
MHRMIVSFIKAHPEQMYKTSDNTKAYATPRSWHMLSELIMANFGPESSPREFLPLLKEVSTGYVGNSSMKFVQYCEDMLNININDVINDYDRIKKDLERYNRDKNSELIQSLKEIDITKLEKKQLDNIVKFLKNVGDDEKTAYLLWILDNVADITNPKLKGFLLQFEDLLRTIKKINKPGSNNLGGLCRREVTEWSLFFFQQNKIYRYINIMWKVQFIVINEFGQFNGKLIIVDDDQYEKLRELSKVFYVAGSGFELTLEDDSFIVIAPDIVAKSILKLTKNKIKEEEDVEE